MKSVCRHRNAGRLQHVDHLRRRSARPPRVHVGQHRHSDLSLHLGEDAQAFVHPEAAERLAELRFALSYDDLKMNGTRERRAAFPCSLPADVDLQLLGFDDARTRQ